MHHPYYQCCVDFDSNSFKQVDWLRHVIDVAQEVSLKTFRKHVSSDSFDQLKLRLGYATRGQRRKSLMSLAKDWHVRYYKSRTPDGHPCVFVKWSAIEFIFLSHQPTF